MSEEDDVDECPICFDTIQTPWFTPCCNHIIHENCYKRCVEERPACPMCRAVTIVIHEVSSIIITSKYNALRSFAIFVSGIMIISLSLNLLCFSNSSEGDE